VAWVDVLLDGISEAGGRASWPALPRERVAPLYIGAETPAGHRYGLLRLSVHDDEARERATDRLASRRSRSASRPVRRAGQLQPNRPGTLQLRRHASSRGVDPRRASGGRLDTRSSDADLALGIRSTTRRPTRWPLASDNGWPLWSGKRQRPENAALAGNGLETLVASGRHRSPRLRALRGPGVVPKGWNPRPASLRLAERFRQPDGGGPTLLGGRIHSVDAARPRYHPGSTFG